MPIIKYTTQISYDKTITEISELLRNAGAEKVIIDNTDRKPTHLTFSIMFKNQQIFFSLPCNYKGVLNKLKTTKKIPKRLHTEDQSLRVGWRILKQWIEAQLALVDLEMTTIVEVFFPYVITKDNITIYEEITENHLDNLRLK